MFGIVTNKKFDMIIMIFIALNMGTMTLDHYGQSDMWNFALDNLNMGFIVVFTTECILKIFALRQYYFTEPWNVFDFVVVVLSICGELSLEDVIICNLDFNLYYSPHLDRYRTERSHRKVLCFTDPASSGEGGQDWKSPSAGERSQGNKVQCSYNSTLMRVLL